MFRKPPQPVPPHIPEDSLSALTTRKREIDEEIARRADEHLEDLKNQLLVIAEVKGVSIAELFGAAPSEPKKKERKKREVKVKYRNPETGDTWSGLGKPKKWLQTKLDEGHAIEEYEVA